MLNAMSNFLTLGLSQFAEDFTAEDREYAVSVALFDAYIEDHIQLSIDEGSLIAKWWDLVTLTPEKNAKDPILVISWARRCQEHREQVARQRTAAFAAEQGMPGVIPSWLGGFELSEDENIECFKLTMKYILENELTPVQQRRREYVWNSDGKKGPSSKARSLHDVLLRKHLGDKNVAQHIYQHGLPTLLRVQNGVRCLSDATAPEHRRLDQLTTDVTWCVQIALLETIEWLTALTSTSLSRMKYKNMPLLHLFSARPAHLTPEQRQVRDSRSSRMKEIAELIARGKMLAAERDKGKRKFDDMSPADKQVLEDFETNELAKRRKMIRVQKPAAFRSERPSANVAAEYGAASCTTEEDEAAALEHTAVSSTIEEEHMKEEDEEEIPLI